jgi:hypothetical protein
MRGVMVELAIAFAPDTVTDRCVDKVVGTAIRLTISTVTRQTRRSSLNSEG